jgi:hypothetical protein
MSRPLMRLMLSAAWTCGIIGAIWIPTPHPPPHRPTTPIVMMTALPPAAEPAIAPRREGESFDEAIERIVREAR